MNKDGREGKGRRPLWRAWGDGMGWEAGRPGSGGGEQFQSSESVGSLGVITVQGTCTEKCAEGSKVARFEGSSLEVSVPVHSLRSYTWSQS